MYVLSAGFEVRELFREGSRPVTNPETVGLMAAIIYATRTEGAQQFPQQGHLDAIANEAWDLFNAVIYGESDAAKRLSGRRSR